MTVDDWPPIPTTRDFPTLQRYAGVRFLAGLLRHGERDDARLLGLPLIETAPSDLWATAERIYDEEIAGRDARAPVTERGRIRQAGDPELAQLQANFAAAKEACRAGHGDGEATTCTYGGLTPTGGYWLGTPDCPLPHGETCQLRTTCAGAPSESLFSGWGDGWIWGVYACGTCTQAYVAVDPQWQPL